MTAGDPSGEIVKSAPEIIRAASASPLGIFALMILVVGVLAYAFFKNAPTKTRVLIFSFFLCGILLYGVAITRAVQFSRSDGQELQSIVGVVIDEQSQDTIPGAQITILSSPVPVYSDSNGKFQISVPTSGHEDPLALSASKLGYDTQRLTVTWPIPRQVMIALKRSASSQRDSSRSPALPPDSDFISIIDGMFESAPTSGEYIGGRARVGYFGKGPIQSSIVTTCLWIADSFPCANVSYFPIATGEREYTYTVNLGAVRYPEREAAILLCIGDQQRVVRYFDAAPQLRSTTFQPICARTVVKRN